MERRYRESVLKKRKQHIKVLAGIFLAGIMGHFLSSINGNFWSNLGVNAARQMAPAVFKYEESEEEEKAPFFIRCLVPCIFAYTWKTDVPAFAIIEVVKEEAKNTEPVAESVTDPINMVQLTFTLSEADTLSLLQENLYVESGFLNPFTGELITNLQIDDRKMLQSYDMGLYSDVTNLVKDFYIVDASTSVDAELLNVNTFTSYECAIEKNTEGPQILIYHSHSQEEFADSVPGDVSTTIVGAGEKLARILTEEYGFQVLHHTGVYDVPSRDDAYSKALPDVEAILKENPTIQVVIDLHRDAVAEDRKLVTTIDGKEYARFMFFNGICRSTNGPITYLSNPYLRENLAFSFQSQVIAESYFPGITRKIYLKAWRYNMHLVPRNMLIELGAQTNTVEEVMNTVEILAFILNEVLSGQ